MDAMAQLALMAKAKSVFESADSFLSFPVLTPKSYAPDQMRFITASTPDEIHAFWEFSTLTNALPQGTIFQPSLDQLLWDVYGGILANAQIAQGSLTAQQTADLEAAEAFLTEKAPDGSLLDSPAVLAYKQYQQAWFAATQDYNNQKITASASTDPSALANWQQTGEPIARARVAAAENDWETKGLKAQVEQAQQTQETYMAQSPALQWGNWNASYIPDIDLPKDPTTNASFAPTVFSPYDITEGDWPQFSINSAEIPNLISSAPQELKNIFDVTSPTSTIDSLTFEYCSVALSRTWCRSEVFSSRFWRFADPAVQLSDGNTPPAGEWPAYISAVVFARNIVVTTHSAGTVQTQPLHTLPVFQPTSVHLAQPVHTPVVAQPVRTPVTQPLRAPVTMIPRSPVFRSPTVTRAQAFSTAETIVAERPATIAINPALRARLMASTFPRVAVQPAAIVAQVPTTPAPTPVAPANNQISILAFVCKRLPKCPNPDPSLQWT